MGVWVNKEAFIEDDKFYQNAIELGVDIICTDYPLAAIKVRSTLEQQLPSIKGSLSSAQSFVLTRYDRNSNSKIYSD